MLFFYFYKICLINLTCSDINNQKLGTNQLLTQQDKDN